MILTVAFYKTLFWISTKVVYELFCCFKAVSVTMWNCCHLGTCSGYTMQPCTSLQCEARHAECTKVMCLAVICHLHFWQNDWNLLHATTVTRGGMMTAIWVSTENWLWRIKCSYWDSNPQLFGHKSSALPLTGLSPCSMHCAPHASNHMSTLSVHCGHWVIHPGAILCS